MDKFYGGGDGVTAQESDVGVGGASRGKEGDKMQVLGAAKKILGLEIRKDRAAGRLWLSQGGFYPRIDGDVCDMSKVPYVVGCVIYVMVCLRLGRAQAVSVDTSDYGVMFGIQQSDLSVVGFMDAGYVEDLDDRRSTTRHDVGGPIYWKFRVQSQVAQFTADLGYMVVAEAAMEKFKYHLDLVLCLQLLDGR
ncbi:uncharacterized protein LOC131153706 [Malania oleifera]|uniref:uncharacterized protein LOC131153706 n=1 Tax=Malania oleifera TaxID=397392 RepID=UPI0025AE4048|nr:uncharacterized protein LOC131153706 [Malania oleifera]